MPYDCGDIGAAGSKKKKKNHKFSNESISKWKGFEGITKGLSAKARIF